MKYLFIFSVLLFAELSIGVECQHDNTKDPATSVEAARNYNCLLEYLKQLESKFENHKNNSQSINSTYIKHTEETISSGTTNAFNTECGSNDYVLSGGFECRNDDDICTKLSVYRTLATSSNTWEMKIHNSSSFTATVRAYVVCGKK